MNKIKGVHHICIKPNKEIYGKTVDFYTQVLGCSLIRSWGEVDSAGCMLDCGDGTIMEIITGPDDGTVNTGSLQHIAFKVEDVESFIEDVRKAGYKITMEPNSIVIGTDYPVQIAFFEGPVGETIEFFKEL